MMKKLPTILITSLLTSPVYAVIELTDTLSFSGFGSTSWARSDNDTPLFINRFIKDETALTVIPRLVCNLITTTTDLKLQFKG